jgi:hypothetical protein
MAFAHVANEPDGIGEARRIRLGGQRLQQKSDRNRHADSIQY